MVIAATPANLTRQMTFRSALPEENQVATAKMAGRRRDDRLLQWCPVIWLIMKTGLAQLID
jgi:hypothetical protein